MFENQQKEVEVLIKSDSEFRSLYQRHQELDSKVRDAELGVLPLDDTTLHNMPPAKPRFFRLRLNVTRDACAATAFDS